MTAEGTQPNATPPKPFTWNGRRAQAALLLAQKQQTDEEIALAVGLKDRTALWRWKQHPDFAARVVAHEEELLAAIKAQGIANRQNRIAGYTDRYRRWEQVIASRAADPTMAAVPGGTTGLLTREIKFVVVYESKRLDRERPDGEGAHDTEAPAAIFPAKYKEPVEVYTVDTGTLRELRAVAQQAAQDLGQWTEKKELSGGDGEPAIKVYMGVDLEDI